MYDYLLVGAGLFGAAFARRQLDKGKTCLVVDKRATVAGNAYTENIGGINVHKYGAHIFHTSDRSVWEFVNRFAKFNDYVNMPKANFNGSIYSLPFNMNTFRELWGVTDADAAKAKINESINGHFTNTPKNLEEQAINLVGCEIYEKLIKSYTEKQWGRSCKELPAFIIKRLPLRFTFDNNYFNDIYQGVPLGGYTKMVENMLKGADVLLGTDFFAAKNELVKTAKTVVYSGRIDEYFDYCFGELEFRSLRFDTEKLNVPDFQGNAVINYTGSNEPFTRIIEHKHFEKTDVPFTIITREYPVAFGIGNEPYYPVNDEKNSELYKKYEALAASEKNVIFGGRLGTYRYLDMDKVIKSALDARE